MVNKKFDQKLFNQNDVLAREKCKNFFAKQGVILEDSPDKYGPDLIDAAKTRFYECERKLSWKTSYFPFDTVQFPQRKAKYVNQSTIPVTFFMLNEDCSKALIVEGQDLVNSPLKFVRNIYVNSDEMFFQVPLDKVQFVDL